MPKKFNKGEWSEIYTLIKLINESKLYFGDLNLNIKNDFVNIFSVSPNNLNKRIEIVDKDYIRLFGNQKKLKKPNIISASKLKNIFNIIKDTKSRTFPLSELDNIVENLGLDENDFKASSHVKSDIHIGFEHKKIKYANEPIGIKSHIGGSPTLLNASEATNFIYEIIGFNGDINKINNIKTTKKLRDRISKIIELGGFFKYVKCQNSIFENNLKKVDSLLPNLLADILLNYYQGNYSEVGSSFHKFMNNPTDVIHFKNYLQAIMLGMFSAEDWDGNYTSNGTIVLKDSDDLVLYHVVKNSDLRDYLFNNTKLDVASSTRHKFGIIYKESDKYYMKLNLQIRIA